MDNLKKVKKSLYYPSFFIVEKGVENSFLMVDIFVERLWICGIKIKTLNFVNV